VRGLESKKIVPPDSTQVRNVNLSKDAERPPINSERFFSTDARQEIALMYQSSLYFITSFKSIGLISSLTTVFGMFLDNPLE
jgi:hypothetical protein